MAHPAVTARVPLAAMLAAALAGCAGDGTGLDQFGNPVVIGTGPVASVTVQPDSVILGVGGVITLTATPRNAAGLVLAGRVIAWVSSNATVARVTSAGLVTAIAIGEARVTASSEGRSGSARVSVVSGEGIVRFGSEVQPLLIFNCAFAGCHGGGQPQQGMHLGIHQAYTNIVNIPANQRPDMMRVRPFAPDVSYLVHKIQGTQATVGGSGGRMPLGGTPLLQSEIDLIRAWIAQGAANN